MDRELKMPNRNKSAEESGSALWFILLAIALLAALAITITRSSGTAEQSGGIEHQKIVASSLLRYAAGLEAAIEQMRLRGVSENDFSFNKAPLAGYANANCGANTACQVFDTGGGGMTYQKPPSEASANDWVFTGANKVTGVGDDANNELLMILPDIGKDLCKEIDAEIGVSTIPAEAGAVDMATKFQGSYAAGGAIDAPAGKKTGCFEGNSSGAGVTGKYYLYHTLIAR
jgi:hypothetical protein